MTAACFLNSKCSNLENVAFICSQTYCVEAETSKRLTVFHHSYLVFVSFIATFNTFSRLKYNRFLWFMEQLHIIIF